MARCSAGVHPPATGLSSPCAKQGRSDLRRLATQNAANVRRPTPHPLYSCSCALNLQHTYDPSTAPFSSSYNLVWTPEQVDSIRTTSRANVRSASSFSQSREILTYLPFERLWMALWSFGPRSKKRTRGDVTPAFAGTRARSRARDATSPRALMRPRGYSFSPRQKRIPTTVPGPGWNDVWCEWAEKHAPKASNVSLDSSNEEHLSV